MRVSLTTELVEGIELDMYLCFSAPTALSTLLIDCKRRAVREDSQSRQAVAANPRFGIARLYQVAGINLSRSNLTLSFFLAKPTVRAR
jgi:hypothetical protein